MSALSYLSPKAEVRPSAIHGRGLFAREAIAKGEIVCIKGGQIFDRRRLAELQPDLGPAEVQITEDFFIGPVRRHGTGLAKTGAAEEVRGVHVVVPAPENTERRHVDY